MEHKDNLVVYAEVIKNLAIDAVKDVDSIEIIGIEKRVTKGLKACAVNVYFLQTKKVSIDVFVNIKQGNKVPETVALIQEKIKNEVESSTKYLVHSVNVKIMSLIFPQTK